MATPASRPSALFLPLLLAGSALLLALSPAPADARLIESFGNCPELNNYYINKLVPLIGPYGLTSSNAYTQTRTVPHRSKHAPGTPGGPAGLRLHRPFNQQHPKRVVFSNITAGPDGDFNTDDAQDGPKAGEDFSTTNVQIKGVDEPDIIKTDGKRVYTLSGQVFSVIDVLNNGSSGKRTGRLTLPTYPDEMLFEGDWILVIGTDYNYRRPVYRRYVRPTSSGEASTVVYQIRVMPSGKPRLVSTLQLEGQYIKSREVDGVARLVLQFNPLNSVWLYYPSPHRGISAAQTEKWNREIIQYSRPGHWLPTYRLRRGKRTRTGLYATCSDIFYSRNVFAGFNILTVVTFPLNGLLAPTSSASVVSNADKVYSTKTSMYVTTSEYHFGDLSDSDSRWGSDYKTSIHRFNVTDDGATYVASGQITGSVINQFAMSEYRGTFFIATTDGATWWSNRDLSRSKLTAFETDHESRTLRRIGQVGNLGIGERIYSVRYIGDTAYVVTFRETDPLYIIDLSNPRKLKVTGELKIPGFSSYLHPVAPGRILGVGQEATLTGVTTGAKVSLFDVSDKTNPTELSTWTLSGSYTDAQWDHRAFLWWRKERVAVMPVNVYQYPNDFYGAIVLDVSDSKITVRGRVVQRKGGYSRSIQRNAIIGKTNLWSMSYDLLQVNNIKKLKQVKAQVSID